MSRYIFAESGGPLNRTERTIEEWRYHHDMNYIGFTCTECKQRIMFDMIDVQPLPVCACGYTWKVEVRPRFYVVRD